jgi:hypothetical protein
MSVWGRVAFAPLVGRDNGFAMASGQPAKAPFPKAFVGVIREIKS